MKVEVRRFWSGRESTLGRLFIDGRHRCYTLEDEGRAIKVKGETRIPAGKYTLDVRYSPKFGHYDSRWAWHIGMLWLRAVPNFQYVYIHPGNRDSDTDGCILPGLGCALDRSRGFEDARVVNSLAAYERIYRSLRGHVGRVAVEVIDARGCKEAESAGRFTHIDGRGINAGWRGL